ncbi:hypothetical protein COU01_03830 [Candidatus Falkowbacteria bacterium CG10_big_fil_rev_8_21_14_0_10_44_15]|uniref:Carbonic anhydrase n=1 Tax=Candidatus Falkowbacteria bacterium CG10_big_fil_rev_8_21_14_0_10_44_15 TaxID=1974569 RepID=A0A2H0UYY8_9BACT|nr:MAG: hypothetical protein COU01_03830 [Candidatus Falkowbacteria bacterium CG10_big_fil_rev_8_21_14_0_10_44_15]
MDFRLEDKLHAWLKANGYVGNCDIISVAGAAKDLVKPGPDRDYLLRHIGIGVNLHQVKRVIFAQHSTCGAYAQENDFASVEEEKAKQMEDMQAAVAAVKGRFPEVETQVLWVELKDHEGRELEISALPIAA